MKPCKKGKLGSTLVQRASLGIQAKKDQTKSHRHLAQEKILANRPSAATHPLIGDKENFKPEGYIKQLPQTVRGTKHAVHPVKLVSHLSTPMHSQTAKSPSPFRNISDKQSHEAALRRLILEESKDETEPDIPRSLEK